VEWANGKLVRAEVRSKLGGNLRLQTAGPAAITTLSNTAVNARPANGENPNPLFRIVDAGQPKIVNPGALPQVSVRATQKVDFATEAGGVYVILPR
jgi:alpha-L-fucosidase 2